MGGEFWQWIWEIYRVTPQDGEPSIWEAFKANREHFVSIVTLIGGAIAAWVALGQLRTARERHDAQIETDEKRDDADRQRRITESFTKAVEQLGSDKLQVRLGGIYTLERVSRESKFDYWPIMETLIAFVRERVRWKDEDVALSETVAHLSQETAAQQPAPSPPTDIEFWDMVVHLYSQGVAAREAAAQQPAPSPPTDIEAVLTVIRRREEGNRKRETSEGWSLDLRSTDLRGANLRGAHLEGARLDRAHLVRADLTGAHLEGARLDRAHLKGADLRGAHLEDAYLEKAHLEGALLADALGLSQIQLYEALGDAETKLPEGLTRPAHWPQ
jgi:hypothetical protein